LLLKGRLWWLVYQGKIKQSKTSKNQEMKLFLSHAAENTAIAEEIFLSLVGAGHEVFFDRSSLTPGKNYELRIREAIEMSDGIIFLISPQSIEPGVYTLTELKYARQKWVHPENRVLPVMVEFTPFEAIPAYLKAVTILQPEGNIASEVAENLKKWTTPNSTIINRSRIYSKPVGLLAMIISSILIAAALGTLFSTIYPRVDINFGLASLFLLVGIIFAFIIRGLFKVIRRSKR
jgi:hypothetical protein